MSDASYRNFGHYLREGWSAEPKQSFTALAGIGPSRPAGIEPGSNTTMSGMGSKPSPKATEASLKTLQPRPAFLMAAPNASMNCKTS